MDLLEIAAVERAHSALTVVLSRKKVERREAWSDLLQCNWEKIHVVEPGRLVIELPLQNCCNMTGAIAFAQSIMPDVVSISTYSGGVSDTRYRLVRGKWAVDTRRGG